MKAISVTLSVVVLASLALVSIPATRDEIHWRRASYEDATASYGCYIETWPGGRHTSEAMDKLESLHWNATAAANTVERYERYLQVHADGKHAAEAKDRIESLHWNATAVANTVERYERYVQLHADSKDAAEAKDRIESLHWNAAVASNTVESYEWYLELHADSKHAAEAKDGIEICSLKVALTENSSLRLRSFIKKCPNSNRINTALQRLISLDDRAWERCRQTNTIDSYMDYVSTYQDGRHEKHARIRMQLFQFNSSFGTSAPFAERQLPFTEEQIEEYLKRLYSETYSTVIAKPLEYYIIKQDTESGPAKKQVVIRPSSGQKACSLQIEADDFLITAVYLSNPTNISIMRPLFPNKWEPTFTHNGYYGPGLQIAFPSLQFETVLTRFSIVYDHIRSNSGVAHDIGATHYWVHECIIPDLLWGSNRDGSPYPHYGCKFVIDRQYGDMVFKVEGVKGIPCASIRTYEQALALKTYIKMLRASVPESNRLN